MRPVRCLICKRNCNLVPSRSLILVKVLGWSWACPDKRHKWLHIGYGGKAPKNYVLDPLPLHTLPRRLCLFVYYNILNLEWKWVDFRCNLVWRRKNNWCWRCGKKIVKNEYASVNPNKGYRVTCLDCD